MYRSALKFDCIHRSQRQDPKLDVQIDLQIVFVFMLYTVWSSLYYTHSDQVGCQTCLKIQLNKLVQLIFHYFQLT